MSTSLTDQIMSQLSGAPLQQISQHLGIDAPQASNAVASALPLLMGALGRNAGQPQGAQSLLGALQKDFAGSSDAGSLLGAVLGGGGNRQTDGAGILGHLLGGKQAQAEAALGQSTGLGSAKAGELLKILAPLVMSFLGKHLFQNQDAAGGAAGGLAQLGSVLGREQQHIQSSGAGGGLLASVLDQDGDGELGVGDLLKIGGSLLGGRG